MYDKAYYQAHKEQIKEQRKAHYQANTEEIIAKKKEYYQARKEEIITKKKAYRQAHKEEAKAYRQAHKEEYNAYIQAYNRSDVNSLGETKNSIRSKSINILKKSGIKIPGYEIHHCFTYDDPSKFIYISRSLHRKIHQYLREHNIDASSDHWMPIRDLVNSSDEFVYIKA